MRSATSREHELRARGRDQRCTDASAPMARLHVQRGEFGRRALALRDADRRESDQLFADESDECPR